MIDIWKVIRSNYSSQSIRACFTGYDKLEYHVDFFTEYFWWNRQFQINESLFSNQIGSYSDKNFITNRFTIILGCRNLIMKQLKRIKLCSISFSLNSEDMLAAIKNLNDLWYVIEIYLYNFMLYSIYN